jgi:hypothetical protein
MLSTSIPNRAKYLSSGDHRKMGQTLTPSSENERFSAPVRTSQMMTRRWSEGPSGEYVTRNLQEKQNISTGWHTTPSIPLVLNNSLFTGREVNYLNSRVSKSHDLLKLRSTPQCDSSRVEGGHVGAKGGPSDKVFRPVL